MAFAGEAAGAAIKFGAKVCRVRSNMIRPESSSTSVGRLSCDFSHDTVLVV